MKKILCILLVTFTLMLECSCDVARESSRDVSQYVLDVDIDPMARRIEATGTLTYRHIDPTPTTEILMQLYPTAYTGGEPIPSSKHDLSYYDGESHGSITVHSVTLNGTATAFSLTGDYGNILSIPLSTELWEGDGIAIGLRFEVDIPKVISRLGVTPNAVNLSYWHPQVCYYADGEYLSNPYYPIGDPFVHEACNYHVTVRYPDGYTLATGMRTVSERVSEGTVETVLEGENMRDLSFVLSERFTKLSALVGSTRVDYYYLTDPDPEGSLEIARRALSIYSEAFGEYPHPRYTVVETDLLYGGMEYTGLVYISRELDASERETVIAHETAHQWWYGIVGSNQVTCAWLDEGLAEYSVNLYYRETGREGLARERVQSLELSFTTYVDVLRTVHGNVDTSMMRAIPDYRTEYEYAYVSYVEGMLMMESLRAIMGDGFDLALRHYVSENRYTVASCQDLLAALEFAAHRPMDGVLDPWLHGNVVWLGI